MTSELVCTAALSALLARARTGEGQRIDVSLLDALVHACRWIMLHERKSASITSATDLSTTLQSLFAETARW